MTKRKEKCCCDVPFMQSTFYLALTRLTKITFTQTGLLSVSFMLSHACLLPACLLKFHYKYIYSKYVFSVLINTKEHDADRPMLSIMMKIIRNIPLDNR